MPALPDISQVQSHPRFRRRGEFRDWGEQKVAARLERALREQHDQSTIVLCNAIITDQSERERQEVDFVVIGGGGVVVIEVKNWSCAAIEMVGQGGCLRDGKLEPRDPRSQPELATKRLFGFLRARGFQEVCTNGLLLFARDDYHLEGDLNRVIPVRLLSQGVDEVVSGRLSRGGHRQRRRLSPQQIQDIANAIWGAQPQELLGRQFPLVIGDYALTSALGRSERRSFVARPLHESALPACPVRLVRHEIGFVESRQEWTHRLQTARRDYDALHRLAKVAGVPVLRHFFADPSDDTLFWTVHDHCDGRSFAELRVPLAPDEQSRRLRILGQVADILVDCHQAGVYHRSLSPDCIWLDEHETPSIVHWELSRITDTPTIGSEVRDRLKGSPYVAPEVRADAHRATPCADAYSLGIILVEQLSGVCIHVSSRDEAVARKNARIDRSLPPGLSNLIDSLLLSTPIIDLRAAAAQLKRMAAA
jgi:hypothetical protein